MNERNYTILKYLKENGEYVTSENLSALCNVSTKTILKDIKLINEDMKSTKNYIDVKTSQGLKLVINNVDEFINLCNSYRSLQDSFVFSVNEREDWIQKYLIESNDWVKSETLCEMLFVSASVLSQNLKGIRKSLSKYDLKLVQKPHYGMRVEGREFNKRLCLAAIYISYIDQRDDFPGNQFNSNDLLMIQNISQILENVMVKYQISMSEVSVQNFIIDISRWTDSVVAVELAKQIHKHLGIEMSDQEIVSLSIHLASKRIIRNFDESIHRIIKDFDVNQIVNTMLVNIQSQWRIDFSNDNELRDYLLLHLIPLEVRSRYNVVLRNPLIDKIKQQNILAYQLAVAACNHLVDYHGNNLSDEEIGYIALHLELALLRKKIKDKKNILVMCGVGRGTSSTLAYQIKEMYGKFINEIQTVDYIGIKSYDFEDVDFLITSTPIKNKLPIPVIEVNYFLNNNDKKRILSFLDDQDSFHMQEVIKRNLIIKNINEETKEGVLSYIIKNTLGNESISKNLIEEDCIGNYELENMLAILSCCVDEPKTKIIIGILSKPILWNKKKVQLVIIPLIGKNIGIKILDLYKELSYFADNSNYIKRIIKKQNQEEIIKIFNDIELKI